MYNISGINSKYVKEGKEKKCEIRDVNLQYVKEGKEKSVQYK